MPRKEFESGTVVATMRLPMAVKSLASWMTACERSYGKGLTFASVLDDDGATWLEMRIL